jgi:hypothetical protein
MLPYWYTGWVKKTDTFVIQISREGIRFFLLTLYIVIKSLVGSIIPNYYLLAWLFDKRLTLTNVDCPIDVSLTKAYFDIDNSFSQWRGFHNGWNCAFIPTIQARWNSHMLFEHWVRWFSNLNCLEYSLPTNIVNTHAPCT